MSTFEVVLPMLGCLVVERVVWVGGAQQGLNRQKDGSDLESRTPVGFQNIETNSAQVVDVGVVNLSTENAFGRGHRVVVGQKQLSIEFAVFIRSSRGSIQFNLKILTKEIKIR